MPTKRLTAVTVANAKAPAAGRLELWDDLLKGFGLRVTENGKMSFVLMTRLHGKQIRLTLGKHPVLTVAQARERARSALEDIGRGVDPRRPKNTGTSIGAVVDSFLERHVRPNTKPKSARETERLLKREVVPTWHGRDIRDLRRSDVVELLDKIVDRPAPYVANRTLSALRKMFRWSIQRGLVDFSPCSEIARPHSETKRARVLIDRELKSIWNATFQLGAVHGPFLRTLIATAQRVVEVAGMQKDAISKDEWVLEAADTKANRAHVVPLSDLALSSINETPSQVDCPLVFSNTGKGPIKGFSKMKAALDLEAGVTGWRLHDIRRTAATNMARAGVDRLIIERVLNHADPSVTAVYDRYGYEKDKRRALEIWAQKISIIANSPDEEGQSNVLSAGEKFKYRH